MNNPGNKTGKAHRIRIPRPLVLVCLLLVPVFPALFSFKTQGSSAPAEEFCRLYISANMLQIESSLQKSLDILRSSEKEDWKYKSLIGTYREARRCYKQIEFFIEYYSPFEARFYLNGPLVPKIEMEISSQPVPPQGFQVIEEALFDLEKRDLKVLEKEYTQLLSRFSFLKEHYSTIRIEESKLLDALRLEIVRIMCLTLNGYDCTINKEALKECAYSIAGIETLLSSYKDFTGSEQKKNHAKTRSALKDCRKILSRAKDSDSFDRLRFMTEHLDPAYGDLLLYFESLQVKPSPLYYAVNFKAHSFFDANSINKQYFSVYVTDSFKLKEQADLGRLLFFDPILSGNNQRACASCHQDNKAFADGLEKSPSFDRQARLPRNVPTLINAAYQKLFFHDGRLFNLEEQANAVFKNVHEMNTSEEAIVRKLRQSEEYRRLFAEAFSTKPDTVITPYAVLKCLSEFIKTLDSRDSRFDLYLRGDRKQLTKEEMNGYNLFSGKALCGSCHFFPLFNGTVPPMYNDNEFEVIGTPESMDSKEIDPDPGRRNVTRSFIHDHAFKTPSLRNIEYTGPYMHNGAYSSLDSVMVFYNRGGGAGSGLKVENQTLPFDSLGLSKQDLNDIKLFLLSLSDTVGLPKAPPRLPRFKDQALNKRKIGGEY